MEVEVEGRTLSLSNLDKVFYPATGFTKGQVIEYYTRDRAGAAAAPARPPPDAQALPGRRRGPVLLREAVPGPPARLGAHRRRRGSRHNGREIDYCLVDDLADARLAGQPRRPRAAHAARRSPTTPKAPTMLAFDLDPGPPATIVECAEVACRLRDAFDHFGLQSRSPRRRARRACSSTCRSTRPATLRAHASRSRRASRRCWSAATPSSSSPRCARTCGRGKVFIDWSQNDEHKTTVCVYSLRARERPTVSTPSRGTRSRRVLRSRDPDDLAFTSDEVLARVAEHGDCFAPVLEPRAGAPAA